MTCRGFLACSLKLSNFILAMVGVAMVIYGVWMLNQWEHHVHPPHAPAPGGSISEQAELLHVDAGRKAFQFSDMPVELALPGLSVPRLELPAPWFIYATLGAGVFTVLVTCTGLLAAETHSACCLSCYTFGLLTLILVQGIASAAIFLDDSWEKDLPSDPTGELDKTKQFVLENMIICKWFGLGLLIVEVLGLLQALTLRALQDGAVGGYDSDEEYPVPVRPSVQRPLLPERGVPSAPISNRALRNDAWSARMREKYGLDTQEFSYNPDSRYNPQDARRYVQVPQPTVQEAGRSKCSIM